MPSVMYDKSVFSNALASVIIREIGLYEVSMLHLPFSDWVKKNYKMNVSNFPCVR